jgi:hypothetical protein
MEHNDIIKTLAPCGLNCSKCMAFAEGHIKEEAAALKDLLGSFDNYAERFSSFAPVFINYPQFKELLNYFTEAQCRGCRKGDCLHPNCGVSPCIKEKQLDFCFQCDEFPCDKSNFDDNLKKRWIQMNMKMKDIGVKKYYEEIKNQPRYI